LFKSGFKIFFIFLIGLIYAAGLSAMTIVADKKSREKFRAKCYEIKKFGLTEKIAVECNLNYQLFNSKSSLKYYSHAKALKAGKVKISSYNMLHPGSLRSGFKDYKLLSLVINNWDIVASSELLPVLGRDNRINNTVIEYLEKAPKLIEKLEEKLELLNLMTIIEINSEATAEKRRIEQELEKLNKISTSTQGLYRVPGYVKILESLRKLDPSWSLLLSPRGDAAQETHVHEMIGFFYRATVVKPVVNEHCKEFKGKLGGKGIACIPNLRKSFMDKDMTEVFSRRPFLASFVSGEFDFSMLTSHVVFGSPDEPEEMRKILMPSFGVATYGGLGKGVTKQTYARWAEAKIILELMKRLREQYYEQDVIYGGDMNLQASDSFFKVLLKDFPGEDLFITGKTTISQPRYHNQGIPTNGLSKNFDHFIFNKKSSIECLTPTMKSTAEIYPYYSGMVSSHMDKAYKVRDESSFNIDEIYDDIGIDKDNEVVEKAEYVLLPGAKSKMKKAQSAYRKTLEKLKKVSNGTIVPDHYRIDERMTLFKKRVFTDQLTDLYFYRMYLELLSDHMPISMSCRNRLTDDDQ
jgi:hypothetical protein